MNLRVISTTDNKYLGAIFDVPFADLTGTDIPISEDVVFSIVKSEDLGGGKHRYSNAHYVAICRVI